jgi:hypothetical protein
VAEFKRQDAQYSDALDLLLGPLRLVGGLVRPEVRRLTSDRQSDSALSWPPDGRQIAYVRALPRTTRFDRHGSLVGSIHLASQLGGSDRRPHDVPVTRLSSAVGISVEGVKAFRHEREGRSMRSARIVDMLGTWASVIDRRLRVSGPW